MAQLLVRNLSGKTLELLRSRASHNRRSLESEVRAILEDTAEREGVRNEFWRFADEMRESLRNIPQSDSADLIREDRER
jgi:plasmid stability protein